MGGKRAQDYEHLPEEGDGRPTREVREDEQRHPLRHGEIRVRGHGIVAADGEVHGSVASGDDEESEAVDQQQRYQVCQGQPVARLHRQADAVAR